MGVGRLGVQDFDLRVEGTIECSFWEEVVSVAPPLAVSEL
jgi:hypothetical protein